MQRAQNKGTFKKKIWNSFANILDGVRSGSLIKQKNTGNHITIHFKISK